MPKSRNIISSGFQHLPYAKYAAQVLSFKGCLLATLHSAGRNMEFVDFHHFVDDGKPALTRVAGSAAFSSDYPYPYLPLVLVIPRTTLETPYFLRITSHWFMYEQAEQLQDSYHTHHLDIHTNAPISNISVSYRVLHADESEDAPKPADLVALDACNYEVKYCQHGCKIMHARLQTNQSPPDPASPSDCDVKLSTHQTPSRCNFLRQSYPHLQAMDDAFAEQCHIRHLSAGDEVVENYLANCGKTQSTLLRDTFGVRGNLSVKTGHRFLVSFSALVNYRPTQVDWQLEVL